MWRTGEGISALPLSSPVVVADRVGNDVRDVVEAAAHDETVRTCPVLTPERLLERVPVHLVHGPALTLTLRVVTPLLSPVVRVQESTSITEAPPIDCQES